MARLIDAHVLVPALLLCCAPVRTASAADAAKGKVVYESRCAFCHGTSGKGDGPAGAALRPSPTNFANAELWKSTSPEALKGFIENGKPSTAMVAFKGTLTAEQIDSVVAFLETLKPQ